MAGQPWRDRVAALLGVSAYERPQGYGPSLDDDQVENVRRQLGGQLNPLPTTKTRFYLADLETAQFAADSGDLSQVGRLYRAMRRDGTLAGLMSTRTSGLVRLPKRFYGDSKITELLRAKNGSRSIFDEMFPPSECALLAADGIGPGVGVAELVPVTGRDYPVMVRLDPEWLRYRWNENRWYYNSVAGPLPITPGDGRWILHTPGGRIAPWNSGNWQALGRAWINKEHAMLHRSNYGAKLANPARAAVAPLGATEAQRTGFLAKLIAWGINTVFELPIGWDVKLLELKGEGYKVFAEDIQTSDLEYMICLAGQVVTVTGGSGFANADIHKSIRADLIKDTADGLAYTLNTQGLPPWIAERFGEEAIGTASMEWDVAEPRDMKAEADSMISVAQAVSQLRDALSPYGLELAVSELATRFGIPIANDGDGDGAPDSKTPSNVIPITRGSAAPLEPELLSKIVEVAKQAGLRPTTDSMRKAIEAIGIKLEPIPSAQPTARLDLAPTDVAKVVRVDEARTSQGLPPIGDDRGKLTITELDAQASAPPEGASPAPAPAKDVEAA